MDKCTAALGGFGLQLMRLGGSELADQVGVIHTFAKQSTGNCLNCF